MVATWFDLGPDHVLHHHDFAGTARGAVFQLLIRQPGLVKRRVCQFQHFLSPFIVVLPVKHHGSVHRPSVQLVQRIDKAERCRAAHIDAIAVFRKIVPAGISVIAPVAGLLDKTRADFPDAGFHQHHQIGKPAAAAKIQVDGKRPVVQGGIRKATAGLIDHNAVPVGLHLRNRIGLTVMGPALARVERRSPDQAI